MSSSGRRPVRSFQKSTNRRISSFCSSFRRSELAARSSYAWAAKYNYRSAVERVNSRLDVSFGFEQHTIRGMAKMKFKVGLALIVMLSMAVGHIKAGREEMMRSLVKAA